jgi:hypothetical protein
LSRHWPDLAGQATVTFEEGRNSGKLENHAFGFVR